MRVKTILLATFAGVALSMGSAHGYEEGDPAKGRQLANTCMGCHGIEGARNAYPSYRVPRIGGQNEQYLFNALKAYRDTGREHPTMRAQAAPMTDEEMRNLAAFFAQER